MNFEETHAAFIQTHIQSRSGERRGRLERGHREAEQLFCRNIWWPLRGHFEQLHPEFEVMDWRGRSYFCDFVFLTPHEKLIIEVKGYGTHVRDMDRLKYCNELNRETFLTAIGYQMISFAYDDVAQRPELCIMLLRMVLSRYQPIGTPTHLTSVMEREVIRLAYLLARPLRPIDVENHLSINHRTVVRTLHTLCKKELLCSITGAQNKHVVRYELQTKALGLCQL
ncbi:DUF559 domain-containing protein [Paenibacillus sp. 481]|uniref:DUF559 domain-containing protein n=1 Tax=Paenibacillus sp. 481 TaxID=2835869 RepID=UPI001E51A552|nr:DUF559 domain-containing protein [Paenibacillus sp. 481]UHA72511.1 DUF559 domain-containing protein [Paenibacillus sp. 481]